MRRLFCALSLAVPLLPFPLLAQPGVTLEPRAAVASGLTPGGQVVWLGVAREISEDLATIVRRDRLDVADAKGGARFELDRDVALKSIWVAVLRVPQASESFKGLVIPFKDLRTAQLSS